MNNDAINQVINNYVRDNLSPKPEHRTYISAKYEALCVLLGGGCFQAGSYARFTAINPVHDLDIIYVVKDSTIKIDPHRFMEALATKIKNSDIPGIKNVQVQTHSVTIIFDDSDTNFSIDVVPALELMERNLYHEPLYEVPEILKFNPHNRARRYQNAAIQPISWIKTDPRGYIRAASELNNANPSFRHATKFSKGWRHFCKMAYEDDFKFKSFHFEQMFFRFFTDHPGANTTDAIIACMGAIPAALEQPQFKDRANDKVFIDQYVRELDGKQKSLIVKLQAEAYAQAVRLPGATSADELHKMLNGILNVDRPKPAAAYSGATVVAPPRQPWAY